MEDIQGHIGEHGVSEIEELFKTKLGPWEDAEINIGIIGNSGVGKSSFINAIRGLADDYVGAAETGVTETTRKATFYLHPTNDKIKLWDLPGTGTPKYPDLGTYCEKVELEKYDAFLILTMKRFTENDRLLVEKVKSLNKSFFFIRTHIDADYLSQKRKKAFDEQAMLQTIREDCLEKLKGAETGHDAVFLISNLYPAKWDFARLTQAILDVLPYRPKECLTLSLLKRNPELLRDVQWTERSKKHHSKLSEFVEVLKTNPSKATRIGVYRVCFDDKFSIGQGSDGTKIYVGLSDDGYEVAIKSIEKCMEMDDNEKNTLNFPEVRNKKHIVNYRFYQSFDSTKVYIVMDLHEESLRDYVLKKERPLEQLRKEGPRIIRQILYRVRTLHCSNPEMHHRDLKPSNILVNVEGEMVLADFGINRLLPENETMYKSGVSGTEGWMAVESLPNEDNEQDLSHEVIQVCYKKQSDIQVVGMLCYYVLTKGKHPYGRRVDRTSNISQGHIDLEDLSDPCARDLITWMLQHDPAERPNVHQCLKHPYLRTAEENFNLVVNAGNEKEIKTKDSTSIVVQELNKLPVFTNWISMIEACVMNYMTAHRCPYTNGAADLLRFIRTTAVHWHNKTPPANVQNTVVTPQKYFGKKFPTLPVELHRIIRQNFDWVTRVKLAKYF